MKVLIFFIAGISGVLLIKTFFLDNIEQIAWNIFWNNISNGNMNFGFGRIINSATFIKSFCGFCIFGFAGLFGFNYYYEKNQLNKRK